MKKPIEINNPQPYKPAINLVYCSKIASSAKTLVQQINRAGQNVFRVEIKARVFAKRTLLKKLKTLKKDRLTIVIWKDESISKVLPEFTLMNELGDVKNVKKAILTMSLLKENDMVSITSKLL